MIKIKSSLFYLFCLLHFVQSAQSQEVSISSEMNIRNYYAYELLGKVGPRYLVYRDKGYVKEINAFNEFMEETSMSELFLENKKAFVIHTAGLDSVFQIIYTYPENDSLIFKMRRYDHRVSLRDSAHLLTLSKKELKKNIEYVVSEDRNKILIYSVDIDGNLMAYVFNNTTAQLSGLSRIVVKQYKDFTKDIRAIELTNEGQILILLQKKIGLGSGSDQNISLVQFDPSSGNAKLSAISKKSYLIRDLIFKYDNLNKKILLCGLYGARKGNDAEGYYILNKGLNEIGIEESVSFISFDQDMEEFVGKSKKKKNRVFQDFSTSDVLLRQDGGYLIAMELKKEFSRRSSYSSGYDRTTYGSSARRGWVDYYNEDVVLLNIDPDFNIKWKRILYKKQFSQDDEAVFSSYFLMKAPSRIRMIFNDEIKTSNTVSEYLIDPAGNIARNSLLSTEYEELKLRFRDAIQISSNEILVPSEINYQLNLVKITY